MCTGRRALLLAAFAIGIFSIGLRAGPPPADAPAAAAQRLTLDEIRQRVLNNNKLLQLAALNVESKGYAARAVAANYFPQIIGQSVFVHFNDDLGTVLATTGRTVSGPRGKPLATFPATAINVAVLNQETALNTLMVAQPVTDLLKVRQGVKVAQADEGIARAQMEKGARELLSGAEQLFWGIWAAQTIRDGLRVAVATAEEAAKTGNVDAKISLVEGQQGLGDAEIQVTELSQQLNTLIDLPVCTPIEIVPEPPPAAPVQCADAAVALALETSPEIHEAEENVRKAHAAVAAAKLDYVPSIAIVGGYSNQTAADYIQPNIGFVGVMGSYTFVDWGKRRNTIREREQLISMATLKVQQTQADVEQKALKAYRDYEQSVGAMKLAGELVQLREEAFKAVPVAQAADKVKAGKDLLTAKVDAVKAELNQRIAYVKLMGLIGKQ
jgi:outer membrane protein TolC